MTSMDTQPPGANPTQGAQQPAQSVPNTSQTPPTPPTGIDQQLASLNQQYEQVRNMPNVGYDERTRQAIASQGSELPEPQGASTNLNTLARQMAEGYGLPLGRGALVDAQGNFLMTPDQIAAASGGSVTLGEAAAKMNYIADALAAKQNEQSQQKAVSALQTGLGQVQSRGRGSLAAMQSGFYQNLASLYANQEYDAADFSYFIQKEQLDMQNEILRRQEDLAKKQARAGVITGVGLGIVGLATGNPVLAAGGFASAGGSAAGTGWF